MSPGLATSSSITVVGGTRPPLPTRVGAIVPVPAGSAVALVISVVVRLAVPVAPPERNSLTRPEIVTAVPGVSEASGGALVKTNTPSEVRSSRSGCGSWMK